MNRPAEVISPSFRRSGTDRRDAPIRALIADDDSAFREYMRVLLLRLGIEAATAGDTDSALAELRQGEFDLLIADYEMPGKNGLELIAAVRGDASLTTIYAVMLTGHDELALKVAALSAGFDDFLPKACSEIEVAAKVAAAQRMLSRQRALHLAANEWYGIAIRDELTGVFSRRFFFEEATRYLSEQRLVSVVLFDLDDFKSVNDSFGHMTGDRVLSDVGRLFLQSTRAGDVIARYGGDEFILLVVGSAMAETCALADRLSSDLAALEWSAGESTLRITATHGVGSSELLPGATVEQLLEAADRELYAKKWLKKNPSVVPPASYEYRLEGKSSEVVPVDRRPTLPSPPAQTRQRD